jgi:hypothetical protein
MNAEDIVERKPIAVKRDNDLAVKRDNDQGSTGDPV